MRFLLGFLLLWLISSFYWISTLEFSPDIPPSSCFACSLLNFNLLFFPCISLQSYLIFSDLTFSFNCLFRYILLIFPFFVHLLLSVSRSQPSLTFPPLISLPSPNLPPAPHFCPLCFNVFLLLLTSFLLSLPAFSLLCSLCLSLSFV